MENRAEKPLPLAPRWEAPGMNLGLPGPHPIMSGPDSATEQGEELIAPSIDCFLQKLLGLWAKCGIT